MADASVVSLLEKMCNVDKDFRYMGVSDLITSLENGRVSLSGQMSDRVAKQLLSMIEDRNSEVQNIVVKCIGSIQRHITEADAQYMLLCISKFIRNAIKQPMAEVYATALREIVNHADGNMKRLILGMLNGVIPDLFHVLNPPVTLTSVHLDLIDILGEIIRRFGREIVPCHKHVSICLIYFVNGKDVSGRKRAIGALGKLLAVCSEEIHGNVVDGLVASVSAEKDSFVMRSKVSAFISAAKGNPVAFAQKLDDVIPLVLRILEDTEDEELMEALLQNIDAFLSCCPIEIQAFIPELHKVLLKALVYDPNYCDGGDGEDEVDEDEDKADSDYDYSDDDDGDLSWKARRSAARALHSMIASQRAMAPKFVDSLGPVLVSRMTEREDTVLCDILSSYTTLVRSLNGLYFSSGITTDAAVVVENELRTQLKSVLKFSGRMLSRKAAVVRTACFDLLSELCKTLPNCFTGNMNLLLSALRAGLDNKDSRAQLKVTTLRFFHAVLESHRKQDFVNVEQVTKLLLSAVTDTFDKVSTDAVYMTLKFSDFLEIGRDYRLARDLFDAAVQKLSSVKNEDELKDRAISCIGHIVSLFGNRVGPTLSEGLNLLVSFASLKYMGCRTALFALVEVARSPSKDVLESMEEQLVQLCCSHMKAEGRDTKMVAIDLLTAVIEGELTPDRPSKSTAEAINLLHQLMEEGDLQVAQVAVNCLAAIYTTLPRNSESSWQSTVDSMATLLAAEIVYGPTLDSLVGLARALVSNRQEPPFEKILDKITHPVYNGSEVHRLIASSIAVVTAEIVATGQQLQKVRVLVKKLGDEHLREGSLPHSNRLFCIFALGEIGRRYPEVYETGPRGFKVEKALMGVLNSNHEDLRTAAAQAFGALAVGNADRFLPLIVNEIKSSDKHKCLLLNSVKEVICRGSSAVLKDALPAIWELLEGFASCDEEGIRLVIAECLGRSCLIAPHFLPKLLTFITSDRSHVRHCALSAFKHVIAHEDVSESFLNEATLEKLMSTVGDPDLVVRRASLTVLNSIIHHRTLQVNKFLPRVLPVVDANLKVCEELIKEVEMGPFKHEVDDGIDIRKGAFQILYSIMEKCPHAVDVDTYILHLKGGIPSSEGPTKRYAGIQDRCHDIRMMSYMMLSKLKDMFPSEVLCRINELVELLRKHIDEKAKPNAVRQEMDKLDELKQTVVRFALNMHNLPGADKYQQLNDLYTYIYNNRTLLDCWPSEFQRPLA